MASSWNMLRLFSIYFILSIQYSLNESSPLYGETVKVVPPGEFDFIVSLTNKTYLRECRTRGLPHVRESAHFCGGSLITPHHVLTAAHCVIAFDVQFHEVEVAIGTTDLRAVADVRQISWWITFCKFLNVTFPVKRHDDLKERLFDIAIIKLDTPVDGVALPTISYVPTEDLYNKSVVIAGWGLNENNIVPSYMQMETFTVVDPWADPEKYKSNETVGTSSSYKQVLSKIRFYTDALVTRTRPGDSGGPVLFDNRGNIDYPNNIVGVHGGSCSALEAGLLCQLLNMHMPVKGFKDFIEAAVQITQNSVPTVI